MSQKKATLQFTEVLEILESYIQIFRADYQNHLFRAILTQCLGKTQIITGSFTEDDELCIFTSMPAVDCYQPPFQCHLCRLQLEHSGAVHIVYDPEDHELRIQSRTKLTDHHVAEQSICQITADMQKALADERLNILVRQKLAG